MRSLKLGAAAAAAICAFTVSADAGSCTKIGAIGDGLTHDIAVIMSTHGLANIIDSRGLKGKGAVHTSCEPGTFVTECRSSQVACK